MLNDTEIKKTFTVQLVNKSIIRIETVMKFEGPESERQTELIILDIEKILKTHPQLTFDILAVVAKESTTHYFSGNSRKMYATRIADSDRVRYIAVINVSGILLRAAILLLSAMGQKLKLKLFETEEEAMVWLSKGNVTSSAGEAPML